MANALAAYLPTTTEPGFSDLLPDLHILVAGSSEPLLAHHDFLKFYSSCVAGLPGPQQDGPWTWDLRGLVLQGANAPVDAEVVRRWLAIFYGHLDKALAVDCWPTRLDEPLRALLLFADAAGTRRAVMQEVAQRLADGTLADGVPLLYMDVDEPLKRVDVLGGRVFYHYNGDIWCFTKTQNALGIVCPVQLLGPLKTSITTATEGWLYLACRLELLPLVRVLMGWVQVQAALAAESTLLLWDGAHCAVSARVLPNLPLELLRQAFLEKLLLLDGGRRDALAAVATAAARSSSCRAATPEELAAKGNEMMNAVMRNAL